MKKKQLLVGLGLLVLLASGLFVSAKLIRRYQALQPRPNADGYLQVDNLKRAYDLYVPPTYTAKKPVPLVIALHGVGGNGKTMTEQTGFNQLAKQAGFIVVYPDAINQHWDTRRSNKPETTNDVGFISALIEELGQKYNLDRDRIYATGFSNGGVFTHRLACELSDKITAIATVSATMPENLTQRCKSTKPISVLMIHGTKDPAISYNSPGKALLSVPDTAKYWRTHNRCKATGSKDSLSKTPNVRMETYQPCTDETAVTLYTIEGGDHVWPGSSSGAIETSTNSSQELNASAVIWDFFNKPSAKALVQR